jgi:hypothetical protein
MTKEEKDLLLQDLCGRLLYRVKIELTNSCGYHHENIAKKGDITIDTLRGFNGKYFTINHDNPLDWDWAESEIEVEDIKPYLFPLSSITDELWDKEFRGCGITEFTRDSFKYGCETLEFNRSNPNLSSMVRFINQLIKNHFDIYGLIPMGLANDATGLGIY